VQTFRSPTTSAGNGHGPPREPRRTSDQERVAIAAVTAVAALVALFLPPEPTGLFVVDAVVRAAFAVLLCLVATRARRWTWLVLAGVPAVFATGGLHLVLAGVAVVVAVAAAAAPRRRVAGAIVAAVSLPLLWQLPETGFNGGSALCTVAATTPVLLSGYLLLTTERRAMVRRVMLAFGVLAFFATFLFAISLALSFNGVSTGMATVNDALLAMEEGEEVEASLLFEEAADSLGNANRWLSAWWAKPARLVPGVAQHQVALASATGESAEIAEVVGVAANRASPERMRYEGGNIDLDQVRATQEPLDAAVVTIEDARERLLDIESPWLTPPVLNRLTDLHERLDFGGEYVSVAADAAHELPGLLGGDGTRRYFVMFTQPAESRGLGGFMGGWALLTAVQGKVDVTESGRANDLNTFPGRDERSLDGPSEYLARYGAFRPWYYLQDVPFSPDFPTDAEVMAELYPQAGGSEIDGVIVVDPYGLAALMDFTGPITVPETDQRLTSDNAAEFLISGQYREFTDEATRRDFLSDAGRDTFRRLVDGNIPGPRRVGEVLGPIVEQRRILMRSFVPSEQAFLDRLGVGGVSRAPERGDGFQLVTQNKGNNKIDSLMYRSVEYDVDLDPFIGSLDATATITLRNDAPAAGLPDALIGNNDQGLPFGTNALYFSFYTPHRLASGSVDGERLGFEYHRELGYRVYSRFIEIPPGESVKVQLELSGELEPGDRYELHVGQQPLVNPDVVMVTFQHPRKVNAAEVGGFGVDAKGSELRARLPGDRPAWVWATFTRR
jgi:hypothetical protein